MDNFSPEIPALLELSKKEAIRHNSPTVDPSHLLVAMLSTVGSEPFTLVEKTSTGKSAYELWKELDAWLFDHQASCLLYTSPSPRD